MTGCRRGRGAWRDGCGPGACNRCFRSLEPDYYFLLLISNSLFTDFVDRVRGQLGLVPLGEVVHHRRHSGFHEMHRSDAPALKESGVSLLVTTRLTEAMHVTP